MDDALRRHDDVDGFVVAIGRHFIHDLNVEAQSNARDAPVYSGQERVVEAAAVPQPAPVLVQGSLKLAQVSAGVSATCGTTLAGDGFCWGDTFLGQLGNATTSGNFLTPVPVLGGHIYRSIDAGLSFDMCGVATDGAFCWGNNFDGQSGNGTLVQSSTPIRVTGSR